VDSAISIEDVRKSLGGRLILDGVNFDVRRADVFGFVGPNGAGKTTTIRILLGLYRADSGRATIMGEPVGSDRARARVGFMMDRNGLYSGMSARDNLAYYLSIYGKPVDDERIRRALAGVGLADRASAKAGSFSTGMRQRLGIARALVHDPDVIILDEPTSGVDPSAQIEIREILVDLARNEGRTILLSSHNMDEVQRICNRVALIDHGAVVFSGELAELRASMGRTTVRVTTAARVDDVTFARLDTDGRFDVGRGSADARELEFTPREDVHTADVVAALAGAGIGVTAVSGGAASLEDVYTTLVRSVDRTNG
jgi:ABC-2 type transport system ATP-binding protein